jgi:hypothetical protein
MWGMYVGMELAERQWVTRLIVESDSKVLIDIGIGNGNLNGATPILIRRIQDLISRIGKFNSKTHDGKEIEVNNG